MKYASLDDFMNGVEARDPHQREFLQAVKEVMDSVWPFVEEVPHYAEQGLLDRLVEPERVIQFRIPWTDDEGIVRVNRGWRVQHNSALGPYKGGMRFKPDLTLSVLKFLAFEQTFKNALTTLPLGGGKGGADFDPKGKSEGEVMRFCQSLVLELSRHVGPHTDVPAGDIGVGEREIGFMAGMARKITNSAEAVFTGKNLSFGGSHLRKQATGYGVIYFTERMLARRGESLEGKSIAISGAGNVAQHAIEKAMQHGARVVTASDSSGAVFDPAGFDEEKFAALQQIKNAERGSLETYAEKFGLIFEKGRHPWGATAEIAMPCATQNELMEKDAKTLAENGTRYVVEGANMPVSADALEVFKDAGVCFAPGKAANAGGVAVSGLEMSQGAMGLRWPREEVEQRLQNIMCEIEESCAVYGTKNGDCVNYVDGANVVGFTRVADAMLAQGVT